MQGWLYRRAVSIKDFGERRHWPTLISFGLWLREIAMQLHINH
jgi:hypothetical protein